jgi:serine/threonine protein kinase
MSPIPARLGDFQILRRIGAGGMAEVFLAEKRGAEGTSKRLVVKRILPGHRRDARLYELFVREARLATGLDHPNIVPVYELVDHPRDGLLLAMEFVDGADLASVLRAARRSGERVPPYVAALIAREAAKGLHYAHQRAGADGAPLEIVHRDVSPQNVLLSREGAVKIADLGVATARLYRDATTGVKGKLRYMAPEQAEGASLDRRADVYALGVVLYEMLRLASPYGVGTDAALLRAVREGLFDPPLATIGDVPADLLAILRRALARDLDARYPTARDLAADLSRALVAQQRVIDESAIEALVRSALEAPADPSSPPETETVAAGPAARRHAAAPPPSRVLAPGARVGRYVIEELLGRGGMADVYAARDTTLDRQVALKILRGTGSEDARRRLLREAKLSARFEHAGSVVIYDVGEEGGVGFIAMELVRGVPLSDFLGDPDVPLARRIRWMASVARVLAAAHGTGLVHRDVKPSNLMIREGGEVKVLDFGIARAAGPEGPRAGEPSTSSSGGSFVGTLRYAAPERLAGGPVDGRVDQFSWGMTAWELFAGRHPFEDGDALEAAGRMLREGIGSLADAAPGVPAEVASVVDRALAMRPADRFADLDEAADALDAFAEAPVTRSTLRSLPEGALDPAGAPRPSLPPPGASLAPPGASLPPPDASLPPPLPSAVPPAPRRRAAALLAVVVAGLVTLGLWRARAPVSAAPPASAAAAPALPVIDALGCADAVVSGDRGADLGHALGMAACARLAPELGVEWAVPEATHHLEVRAALQTDRSVLTLRLAGREATGAGETPIAALWAAIAALTPQLGSPPWPPERVRLWGARDEASARRIFGVWRRSSLRISRSGASEIWRLMETDGDSPMPHVLALMNAVGGRDLATVRPRILARLDRLPPARADALRGQLQAFPAELDRRAAARLMREAYAAGPDDHSMTASYGALAFRLGLPEASAVVERLHQQAPTYAISPLENATYRTAYRDEARAGRYVAWLGELLPESGGRIGVVHHLVSVGRLAEARAGLDLAQRLGVDGPGNDPLFFTDARVQIDLAALDPAAARERSALLVGDPRFFGSMRGSLSLVASYFQEGRFGEAARTTREQAERARDQGDLEAALGLALGALRRARWLAGAVDPLYVTLLERALAESPEIPPLSRVQAEAELALSRGGRVADEALARIEAAASRPEDDAVVQERALVAALPLVRKLRGDRAATALWARTEHAPYLARRSAALDAALALEATGDAAGAEAAYRLAADPMNNVEDAAQRVLALARLASIARKQGRVAGAAADETRLDALWAHADPGLREAVARLR